MPDIDAQRQSMLEELHPIFREVDLAVAKYIELTHDNPRNGDAKLVDLMIRSGVEKSLANDCVTFVPLAFGRVVVDGVGMTAAKTYIKHDLSTGESSEFDLSTEFAFVWSKSISHLYQQSEEFHATFSAIATLSAEVDAINNALHGGVSEAELQELIMDPVLVYIGHPKRPWWKFW